MIDIVMHREWHARICAIHRTGRGIHQVLDAVMAAAFQDVHKTQQVGIDVSVRIFQRVTHPCLRSQIHDALRLIANEYILHRCPVMYPGADLGKTVVSADTRQTCFLQVYIVIVVDVIDANYLVAALQQAYGKLVADETSSAGDENLHEFLRVFRWQDFYWIFPYSV